MVGGLMPQGPLDPSLIPDGTVVRGRPIRYGEKNPTIDVPDYEPEGIGAFVGKWPVEEESIELVGHLETPPRT
jgi:hypothetical protein